ncbi:YgaP-like transmembrane domain [Pseudomonas paralcaligenes]|uniref:YgaP-like transmembrane domain n=1 Tax=Pseudomonas paralcaligenes TaxID=2772558 RepID=UPI001C7F4DFE|nr:YgaP-like transmembrane domain [Pseudomonas paralcaligenes]
MHNVHGYERTLSIGLGLAGLVYGLHRADACGFGLAALGGLGLLRGLTGHCAVKGYLHDPQQELHYLKAEMLRLREAIARLGPQNPEEEPPLGADTMVHGFDRSLLNPR